MELAVSLVFFLPFVHLTNHFTFEQIRDLRSGIGHRRQRTTQQQRPLSRVFLDGSR